MATAHSLSADALIETVIDIKRAERSGNSHSRASEAAMARRLAQLQAALGEQPPSASPAPFPGANIRQATPSKTPLVLSHIAALGVGALLALWLNGPVSISAPTQPPSEAKPLASPAPLPSENALTAVAAPSVMPAEISDEQAVDTLISQWQAAWQSRDIPTYLAAYGEAFLPADGATREAWVAVRRKKLSSGAPITLAINDVQLERRGADRFEARFRQDYAAGTYRESGRSKTLLIAREGGAWKIIGERMN